MFNVISELSGNEYARFPFLECYLAFDFVMHLFQEYLEWRQLSKTKEPEIPDEVYALGVLSRGDEDEKKYMATRQYQIDKRLFGMLKSWVDFCVTLVGIIWLKPYIWKLSGDIVEPFMAHYNLGALKDVELYQFMGFYFIGHWVMVPVDTCWSLYSDFVIEERHGFNKKTLKLFVADFIKSELLMSIFACILIPIITYIIKWGGESFYVYLWAFLQVFGIFMMWFAPNFIMPLFNKFEQLTDHELLGKIQELAAQLKFPLYKLFQIDGSKRSAHSNAYFFGFWKFRRIVLYDTLLHLPHTSILAILGHELGHWKLNHTLKNMVIASVQLGVTFKVIGTIMFSPAAPDILASFGLAGATHSVMMSVVVCSMLLQPIDEVLTRAMTYLTRVHEFQADAFAVDLGKAEGLKEGLKSLSQENKSDLNTDWLWGWYHLSHPTLIERLKAINKRTACGNRKKYVELKTE